MVLISSSNLRFIRTEEGDRVAISMIHIIMTEEMIKVGIDQTVEIGELILVGRVEVD